MKVGLDARSLMPGRDVNKTRRSLSSLPVNPLFSAQKSGGHRESKLRGFHASELKHRRRFGARTPTSARIRQEEQADVGVRAPTFCRFKAQCAQKIRKGHTPTSTTEIHSQL